MSRSSTPGRATPAAKTRRVRRRRVLYVSGFDPRGASFYHRMLRDEAAKHATMAGEPIDIGTRRTVSPIVQAWTVAGGSGSDAVETVYEFLRWDDIVREHWPRRTLRVWADTLVATWVYLRAGVVRVANVPAVLVRTVLNVR